MENLLINRQEAFELIKKYNTDKSDLIHYLESEIIMKFLARKFGENEEYWAMLGLLHDIDWGITKQEPQKHLTKASEILKKAGFDDKFISIVVSHGYGFDVADLKDKKRTEKIEHALACSETITGLIHAYALMRERKVSDMEVNGLKKKFKDKTFAKNVDREIILECEKFGLTIDEFFQVAIDAIKSIKEEVDLK